MSPQPGDVILYPADEADGRQALSSEFVVAGETLVGLGKGLERYSHAAIASEDEGFQYEAVWPKSGHNPIDTSRVYEVWDIGRPSEAQRRCRLGWCRAHVGDFYDLPGVLTAGLVKIPGLYYCSRYACLAIESDGVTKVGDAIDSPNSIPDYRGPGGATMVARYTPGMGPTKR